MNRRELRTHTPTATCFLTKRQRQTLEGRQHLQEMVLVSSDRHRYKSETTPLPLTPHKAND